MTTDAPLNATAFAGTDRMAKVHPELIEALGRYTGPIERLRPGKPRRRRKAAWYRRPRKDKSPTNEVTIARRTNARLQVVAAL